MTPKSAAVDAAGWQLHLGRTERDSLPPRIAAERAWEPSGPTVDQIEQQIRAQRGLTEGADAA